MLARMDTIPTNHFIITRLRAITDFMKPYAKDCNIEMSSPNGARGFDRPRVAHCRRKHSQITKLAHESAPCALGNSLTVEVLLWVRIFLALVFASVGAHTEAAVHYQQLKSFGFPEKSERTPDAPVIEGTDGALYGTTYTGGIGASGSIYRVNKDGTGYQVIHHFGVTSGDGQNPYSKVLEGT